MTDQSKIRNFSIIALVLASSTSLASPPGGKAHSFRCSSSPRAALRRPGGPDVGCASVFAHHGEVPCHD